MQIKFQQQSKGFSATFSGLNPQEVNKKVQECREGNCSCDCSPEVMQKIENIEVAACQEGTKITITGDVSIESIAPMMHSCLMDKEIQ